MDIRHRWRAYPPTMAGWVAVFALIAGAWSVVGSLYLFPYLSDNVDEAIYLLQADALRHGYLFPPAPENGEAFLPWLTVQSGDHFVPKYAPVHAAIIALARTVFGAERAALALIAVAAVASCYLLAREVLRDRKAAVVAAAAFAFSPLFLVQSATFLAYLSSLALLQGFAAALLAGVRLSSSRLLVGSGLAFGVAVFARPYDALLFGAPFGAWLLVTHRHQLLRFASDARWFAIGTAVPLGALLAYFQTATGSPFRSPFNLLDPSDTLGFGSRRMIPAWEPTLFTPARAWEGLSRHAVLHSLWHLGGLALVALAVVGLVWRWRGRRRPPGGAEPWLALVALTIPAGYFFFWGTYGSTEWGGPTRLGPFYHLPVLSPLAILGASGFVCLWGWRRVVAALTAGAMLVFSGVMLARIVKANAPYTAERHRLHAPLLSTSLNRAVVFLPPLVGPWLLQPFALARNSASYDGPVIWALDRGDDANLDVLSEFPGRVPYRLRAEGSYRPTPPIFDFTTFLEPQVLVRGRQVTIELVVDAPTPPSRLVVDVAMGTRRDSFTLRAGASAWDLWRLPLRLSAGSITLVGPVMAHTTSDAETEVRGLDVSVSVTSASAGSQSQLIASQHVALRQQGSTIEVLVPKKVAVIEPLSVVEHRAAESA